MQTNPYHRRLEAELVALRTRRVAIRRTLDAMSKGVRYGGDDHDQIVRARELAIALKATQRDWERLHYELGRDLPGPAVRLDVPAMATSTGRGAVKITPNPVRRDIQAELRRRGYGDGGYIKKVVR
jgi:hypothetical protein